MAEFEPTWGIGTEFEVGIVKDRQTLLYNSRSEKFELRASNDSLIRDDADLKKLIKPRKYLDNLNEIYPVELEFKDLGYGEGDSYTESMISRLKAGEKMPILSLWNPTALEISRPIVESEYGNEIVYYNPGILSSTIVQKLKMQGLEELRDFEPLKTPTGKFTSFLILELATDNWKNLTIDEHIKDNHKFIEKFIRINSEKMSIYNGELYFGFNQKIYQHNDDFMNGVESPIVNIGRLGAIHMNVTMPVADQEEEMFLKSLGDPKDEGTIRKIKETYFYKHHELLAFMVQYLQPILMGFFGVPDFKSLFDDSKFARASYRSFTNRLSNSPFVGLSQFGVEGSLYNAGREAKAYCNVDNFTDKYIAMIKEISGYSGNDTYNIENLGCDINRRIEEDKGRNQFFGFEIRNISYSGHTDMTYYGAYLQIVFLLSYFIIVHEKSVTKLRRFFVSPSKDGQSYPGYDAYIASMKNVLTKGCMGELHPNYISPLYEILEIEPLQEGGGEIPYIAFYKLYTILFNVLDRESPKQELYRHIIGKPIDHIPCVNLIKLFDILKHINCTLKKPDQVNLLDTINIFNDNHMIYTKLVSSYLLSINKSQFEYVKKVNYPYSEIETLADDIAENYYKILTDYIKGLSISSDYDFLKSRSPEQLAEIIDQKHKLNKMFRPEFKIFSNLSELPGVIKNINEAIEMIIATLRKIGINPKITEILEMYYIWLNRNKLNKIECTGMQGGGKNTPQRLNYLLKKYDYLTLRR